MHVRPSGAVTVGILSAASAMMAGCGSSPSARLSADVTNRMNQALVVTRAAADAQDKVKAVGALTALSSIVTREARAGHLSDAHERALRTGIAQARRRIELDVEASQPAPSVQPPPAKQQPAPVAPGPAKGRGKGNGKSKGKG